MRLLAVLIAAVIVPLAGNAQTTGQADPTADDSARTSITIFKYRGVDPTNSSGAQFDAFRGLIEQKFENLSNHFESKLEQGADANIFKYIKRISIQHNEQVISGNNQVVLAWMQTEVDVLQVLQGTIVVPAEGNTSLITRAHFAEDPEGEKNHVFSINLQLTAEEFANSRDSHSLVILYSIATEAKRLGVDRSQISVIVAFALDTIADLERRNGSLDVGMLKIKDAWLEFNNAL